jgi:hypothetical protein
LKSRLGHRATAPLRGINLVNADPAAAASDDPPVGRSDEAVANLVTYLRPIVPSIASLVFY